MKIISAIFLVYLCIASNLLSAQTPEIIWQHTYGGNGDDRARDILATDDGGYLTIGNSPSTDGDVLFNNGLYDMLVIKTDSVGNIEWTRAFGGPDYDYGSTAIHAIDVGFILGGAAGDAGGDIAFNHGQTDFWLIKIDESGNIEWEKTYGGSSYEIALDIEITTDGNYIVTGATSSSDGDVIENKGFDDYWILKIDPTGEIIWGRTYGSSASEGGYDVQQVADGGYIVAGYTEGYDGDVTENKGSTDFWIIKLDSEGEMEWQKTYGGSDIDQAYSIVEKPEGGYMCVGVTYSNNGDVSGMHGFDDIWLISIDSEGILEWQRPYGGTDGGEDGRCVIVSSELGYTLCGISGYVSGDVIENNGTADYWIIQINEEGNILWQKSIGGSNVDFARKIIPTLDNHLIVTGYSNSSDYDVTATYGTFNFWVVKLGICDIPFYADADGDGFGDVLQDTLACVLPIGFVSDTTDCNDADNTVYPTATDICNGIDDNCNGLIDEDAEYTTYYADVDGDGFGNAEVQEMFCNTPTGYVLDNTDCDDTNENIYPGAPEILNGVDDNCDGIVDEDVNINTISPAAITLYPNPANTEIYIKHDLHILAIITRNNIGEEISILFTNDVADISTLPAGIYFSEITAEEGRVIVSWVKR